MIVRKFESSSSSAVYTAQFNEATGESSCDCPGWKFKRAVGPRRCKHTDAFPKVEAVPVVEADPFERIDYLPSIPAHVPAVAPTPSPMLASPLPEGGITNPAEWVAEEKYDGHRLVVRVAGQKVSAVSRLDNARALPAHIVARMKSLPDGVYDGELMIAGGTSSSVSELTNSEKLIFVAFDILEAAGLSTMHLSYLERRAALEVALGGLAAGQEVMLAAVWQVDSSETIRALAGAVWSRGGEGLILKRKASTYTAGKRTKDWVKIKALRTAVLTITGYEKGLNGPFAKVLLVDEQGNTTTVKTLNNAEIRNLTANGAAFIGRKLRIEFQERTADGSYRHPRWDRFEDQ